MKCNACDKHWPGTDTYCPTCGSPLSNQGRGFWWEVFWVAAVLALLIWMEARSK